MKAGFFFFILILLAAQGHAQRLRDTVFFRNGTMIIGEIKRVKLGVLTFKPDDANEITVKLPKIRGLSTRRIIFRIETTRNQVYFGNLSYTGRDQIIQVTAIYNSVELHVEEISLLFPFKERILQRFSGNIGAGLSYTRSSNFGQLNFNGKLAYTAQRDEVTLSTVGIYSITDSTFTRDRQDLSLKNNYYFSTTWFGTLLLSYQHNLELGLQRRFQGGIGAGNKYLTTRHVYAWARSGVVFNQEKSIEGVTTGTLTELFGQVEFNFFKFTKPEVNFVLADGFFYSLSQSGRVRNDGEATLYWEIIKDFKFNFSFYSNFDSRPPGAGANFDFGLVVSLNYTF